jgi:hypothetical protein
VCGYGAYSRLQGTLLSLLGPLSPHRFSLRHAAPRPCMTVESHQRGPGVVPEVIRSEEGASGELAGRLDMATPEQRIADLEAALDQAHAEVCVTY